MRAQTQCGQEGQRTEEDSVILTNGDQMFVDTLKTQSIPPLLTLLIL